MRLISVVIVLVCAGCGGSSPTNPQPPVTTPPVTQPQTWTLTGTINTTLTGEPVVGAALTFGTQTISANSAGRWTLTGTGTISGTFGVEVTAPGYLTRKTGIKAENGRDVTIDLIRDGGAFSLGFYRQFVRNGLDQPSGLQWTRRWTKAPNFYINTRNVHTGRDLSAEEVSVLVEAIQTTIPLATGGTLQAGAIDVGIGERPAQAGYIAVSVTYEPNGDEFGDYCGRATVAADPGWIKVNYDRCASECGSMKVSPRTMAHELMHAMGFWHTSNGGLMDVVQRGACNATAPSSTELHHARILYSRPVGNADVDWDQPSTPLLHAFLSQPPPVVSCFRR
jgi:hypothetical protein